MSYKTRGFYSELEVVGQGEACDKINRMAESTWDEVTHNGWKQPMAFDSVTQNKYLETFEGKSDSELYDSSRYHFDVDQAYIVLNTWYLMFSDLTMLSPHIMREYYKEYSLFQVCQDMDDIKSEFLKHQGEAGFREVLASVTPAGHPLHYLIRNTSVAESQIMTFINYTKRVKLETLNSQGLMVDKFLKNQERLRKIDWDSPTRQLIVAQIKHVLDCLWYGVKPDESVFILPPGQYLENIGKKYTYAGKFATLSRYASSLPNFLGRFFYSLGKEEVPNYNQMFVVPKNYKQGRTISIESIIKNYMGYTLTEGLTRRMTRKDLAVPFYLKLNDGIEEYEVPTFGCYLTYQESNQRWAKYGSRTGEVCTVDSTMASDSISKYLMENALPDRIAEFAMKWRSEYCKLPTRSGSLVLLQTGLTMGHSLTFQFETGIFYAVDIVAACWETGFSVWNLKPKNKLMDLPKRPEFLCSNAIGDDLICHKSIVDTVKYILTQIGFIPNDEKTFTEGKYRESCGKEYWDGNDVTGKYYPRGTSRDRLTELIQLQHKLIEFPQTNLFLCQYIRHLYADVTKSEYGSPYNDIWLYESQYGSLAQTPMPMSLRKFRRKPVLDKDFWTEVAGKSIKVYDVFKYGQRHLNAEQCPTSFKVRERRVKGDLGILSDTCLEVTPDDSYTWELLKFFIFQKQDTIDFILQEEWVVDIPELTTLVKDGYLDKRFLEEDVIEEECHEGKFPRYAEIHTSPVVHYVQPDLGSAAYGELASYAYALAKTSPINYGYGAKGIDYSVDIRTQVTCNTETDVKNKLFLL